MKKYSFQKFIGLIFATMISIAILITLLIVYIGLQSVYKNDVKQDIKDLQDSIVNNIELTKDNINTDILRLSINRELQDLIEMYQNGEISRILLQSQLEKIIEFEININDGILGCDVILGNDIITKTSQFYEEDVRKVLLNVLMEDNEPFRWLGPYHLSMYNGLEKNVFVIKKNIISIDSGVVLGTVYTYVDENLISNLLNFRVTNSDTEYYLINEGGDVISAIDKDMLYLVNKKDILGQFDTNKEYININTWENINQWSLMSKTSKQSMMQGFSAIKNLILVVLLLGVIVVFTITKKISIIVTKPITSMVSTMKSITEGNLEKRMDTSQLYGYEVWVLSTTFNELMDNNKRLLQEVFEKEEGIRRYSFKIMQEQIKPHFMYNALSTTSALVKLNMNDEAVKMIDHLVVFFRISLSNGKSLLKIEEEEKVLVNYLEVQSYRYHDKFTYHIDISDELKEVYVPKLTLQPLVENSIVHGNKKREKLSIHVKGYIQNQNAILEVKDNGIGIEQSKIKDIFLSIENNEQKYFGLTCVAQRLNMLFYDQCKMEIESKVNEYTIVRIIFPLRKKENTCIEL